MSSKEKQAPPKKVEVELVKPHTHAGHEYAPGAKIEVRPDQAEWLKERGIIK
jgi:hypothetical protein